MSAVTRELIRGEINLKPRHHGSVATIGSFDGVHLGHQAIIRQLKIQSRALQLPAVAVIFEPQPREFFGVSVPRLLPLREKVMALFAAGIDRVLCLRFDHAFSAIEPEQFVEKILVQGLGVKYLVIGDDFRFGRNRKGDEKLLQLMAAKHQFALASADMVEVAGERVSSTLIRECLSNGKFSEVETLLGRPFAISGRVVHGQKLGKTLGIPTVNVRLRRNFSPLFGTFAVEVDLGSGRHVRGVANIGLRPTIGGNSQPLLEAHLFDVNEDLYGKRINVVFKAKLRDEKKFSSVDELKQQILKDIEQAKHILNS